MYYKIAFRRYIFLSLYSVSHSHHILPPKLVFYKVLGYKVDSENNLVSWSTTLSGKKGVKDNPPTRTLLENIRYKAAGDSTDEWFHGLASR